jgi:hypothetical protein
VVAAPAREPRAGDRRDAARRIARAFLDGGTLLDSSAIGSRVGGSAIMDTSMICFLQKEKSEISLEKKFA